MSAYSLRATPVERIWGRHDLPSSFPSAPGDGPTGEIWFEAPAGAELLVKYLFTSDRLSIQVHPGDEAARARGLPRGKDEAWFVLETEPGAVIGLGLTRDISAAELREAALDGSIEALIDWRPVRAGDIYYSPAGTIHAIGGGIALIEIQQNLDLTYRLYDYGRPRELHLEEALAVAVRGPWSAPAGYASRQPGHETLASGGRFSLERWKAGGEIGDAAIVVPIASGGLIEGQELVAGSVWCVDGTASIAGDEIDLLVASPA